MNKAKVVYYDKDGDMVKSTLYKNKDKLIKSEIAPNTTITKKLKLIGLGWLNSGVTFWFADETGRRYPMSDNVLIDYLDDNPIDFGERTFEFLQQGHVYSIGFVEGAND